MESTNKKVDKFNYISIEKPFHYKRYLEGLFTTYRLGKIFERNIIGKEFVLGYVENTYESTGKRHTAQYKNGQKKCMNSPSQQKRTPEWPVNI